MMKIINRLIATIVLLLPTFHSFAEEPETTRSEDSQEIKQRVEKKYAEDIKFENDKQQEFDKLGHKQKDEKLKVSEEFIDHYKSIVPGLRNKVVTYENSVESINQSLKQLQVLQLLVSTSDEVFNDNDFASIDGSAVPPALKPHYMNVLQVIKLRQQLDGIFNEIETLEKQLGYDARQISDNIKPKVDAFFDSRKEFILNEEHFTTFSEAQRQYVEEELQDKYNTIINKYFP